MLTHDTTVVIRELNDNYGIAIDTVEMKIYFKDGVSISRANLDGTGVEVFLQNAAVWKMAIDWIGRRIFWTTGFNGLIYVIQMDGKRKRALTKVRSSKFSIAVDPIVG